MRFSFDEIIDILMERRKVLDLDSESRIREAGNRLSARAFFEMMVRLDSSSPQLAEELSATLEAFPEGHSYLIGFCDTTKVRTENEVTTEMLDEPHNEKPSTHYLRLVFRDEQAAYYQFDLFPSFSAEYIIGAGRKRAGAIQHIRLELSDPRYLQDFIESCFSNPHFLRVEESTAEEFQSAPSHG